MTKQTETTSEQDKGRPPPRFGSWVAGGNSTDGRSDDDFYSTPVEVTEGLIIEEGQSIPEYIWEPCCGIGAMSKVLEANGHKVHSTDLIERGYGKGKEDFLKYTRAPFDAVITNPPFELAEKMIRHAFEINVQYLALVLKSQFWHAARRVPLFVKHPPSRIYAMTWRPDFTLKGSPTMDCIWCVWDNSHVKGQYKVMRKP